MANGKRKDRVTVRIANDFRALGAAAERVAEAIFELQDAIDGFNREAGRFTHGPE